ncbi:hypothetical protein R2F25_38280 [Streptomyces sp. UP1A-1]|nr:hypothetical protein [Streptomyces sp. UP1A-1]
MEPVLVYLDADLRGDALGCLLDDILEAPPKALLLDLDRDLGGQALGGRLDLRAQLLRETC